ncbi:MAG TPA: class I SAM-dependent methyltransferase [Amaricoccus sp.]|nr:class I SAM-dependent methyltransferase [Amaricoccus sp.]
MPTPAENYEAFMVPPLFAPWAEALAERGQPAAGAAILDVGCGTGIVARRLARRGGRVVGLDATPAMLDVARAAAAREGLAVEWRDGIAERLPFGAEFDLVTCQFALMFFSDRAAALAEMRRVLRPGGRLALSVFQPIERHPFYRALDRAIRARLGASGVGEIFALGDAGALAAAIAAAGFRDVAVEPASMDARFPDAQGFLAGEIEVDTAAIPSMQGLGPEARRELVAALGREMAAPLAAVSRNGAVIMPFHVLIATARA